MTHGFNVGFNYFFVSFGVYKIYMYRATTSNCSTYVSEPLIGFEKDAKFEIEFLASLKGNEVFDLHDWKAEK